MDFRPYFSGYSNYFQGYSQQGFIDFTQNPYPQQPRCSNANLQFESMNRSINFMHPQEKSISRPLSPLPGTEEYTQRNIEQTSEFIKQQLNIDNSQMDIEKSNDTVNSRPLNISNHDNFEGDKVKTVCSPPRKINKHQKQKNLKSPSVQEIYDKIIHHISKLNYNKKLNLVNKDGSTGYDIAIQQIQKQKRLELSKAFRDMLANDCQDKTDTDVINSIIPDIGINIENLPKELIAELSSTLNLDFDEQIQTDIVSPKKCFKEAEKLCASYDVRFDSETKVNNFSKFDFGDFYGDSKEAQSISSKQNDRFNKNMKIEENTVPTFTETTYNIWKSSNANEPVIPSEKLNQSQQCTANSCYNSENIEFKEISKKINLRHDVHLENNQKDNANIHEIGNCNKEEIFNYDTNLYLNEKLKIDSSVEILKNSPNWFVNGNEGLNQKDTSDNPNLQKRSSNYDVSSTELSSKVPNAFSFEHKNTATFPVKNSKVDVLNQKVSSSQKNKTCYDRNHEAYENVSTSRVYDITYNTNQIFKIPTANNVEANEKNLRTNDLFQNFSSKPTITEDECIEQYNFLINESEKCMIKSGEASNDTEKPVNKETTEELERSNNIYLGKLSEKIDKLINKSENSTYESEKVVDKDDNKQIDLEKIFDKWAQLTNKFENNLGMLQNINKLDKSIDQLEKPVDELEKSFDKFEKPNDTFEKYVEKFDKPIDKLERPINILDSENDKIHKEISLELKSCFESPGLSNKRNHDKSFHRERKSYGESFQQNEKKLVAKTESTNCFLETSEKCLDLNFSSSETSKYKIGEVQTEEKEVKHKDLIRPKFSVISKDEKIAKANLSINEININGVSKRNKMKNYKTHYFKKKTNLKEKYKHLMKMDLSLFSDETKTEEKRDFFKHEKCKKDIVKSTSDVSKSNKCITSSHLSPIHYHSKKTQTDINRKILDNKCIQTSISYDNIKFQTDNTKLANFCSNTDKKSLKNLKSVNWFVSKLNSIDHRISSLQMERNAVFNELIRFLSVNRILVATNNSSVISSTSIIKESDNLNSEHLTNNSNNETITLNMVKGDSKEDTIPNRNSNYVVLYETIDSEDPIQDLKDLTLIGNRKCNNKHFDDVATSFNKERPNKKLKFDDDSLVIKVCVPDISKDELNDIKSDKNNVEKKISSEKVACSNTRKTNKVSSTKLEASEIKKQLKISNAVGEKTENKTDIQRKKRKVVYKKEDLQKISEDTKNTFLSPINKVNFKKDTTRTPLNKKKRIKSSKADSSVYNTIESVIKKFTDDSPLGYDVLNKSEKTIGCAEVMRGGSVERILNDTVKIENKNTESIEESQEKFRQDCTSVIKDVFVNLTRLNLSAYSSSDNTNNSMLLKEKNNNSVEKISLWLQDNQIDDVHSNEYLKELSCDSETNYVKDEILDVKSQEITEIECKQGEEITSYEKSSIISSELDSEEFDESEELLKICRSDKLIQNYEDVSFNGFDGVILAVKVFFFSIKKICFHSM